MNNMGSVLSNEEEIFNDIVLKTLNIKEEENQIGAYFQAWWDVLYTILFTVNPDCYKYDRQQILDSLLVYQDNFWYRELIGEGDIQIDLENGGFNYSNTFSIIKNNKIGQNDKKYKFLKNYITIIEDSDLYVDGDIVDNNSFKWGLLESLFKIEPFSDFYILYRRGYFRYFYNIGKIGYESKYNEYIDTIISLLNAKNVKITKNDIIII